MAGSNVAGRSWSRQPANIADFIKANMPLAAVASLPGIVLHVAHPASGLWRLSKLGGSDAGAPPYWAYPWAGGAALARYFIDRPEIVSGRRVLDLGAGSGVVGIAAAKSGARKVRAAEIDPHAVAALRLNGEANGVAIEVVAQDITRSDPPPVDLVAVGDLFYERALAARVTAFLDRCLADGLEILIGDIGRVYLPRPRLRLIAEYPSRDFGDGENAPLRSAGVYAFLPASRRRKARGRAAIGDAGPRLSFRLDVS